MIEINKLLEVQLFAVSVAPRGAGWLLPSRLVSLRWAGRQIALVQAWAPNTQKKIKIIYDTLEFQEFFTTITSF